MCLYLCVSVSVVLDMTALRDFGVSSSSALAYFFTLLAVQWQKMWVSCISHAL